MRSSRHGALVEAARGQVPGEPGVYLLYGDGDEVLYVGKAVNLRERILSHLQQNPQVDEPRHSRLVHGIRRFEYQTTASELLALLREDELIKQHRPRFNFRQNEFLEHKYLELTREEYPRLCVIDHAAEFGGRRVFGPFRDRYLAERILQLIQHHLGLRSCVTPHPVEKCIEFDLGHCAGACRGAVTPNEYRRTVERVAAFLEGDVAETASRLGREMERAAQELDFEKAQQLKEQFEFCRRFGERQVFLRAFREQKLIVTEKCDPKLTYVFLRGRLVARGLADELADGMPSEGGGDPVEEDDPRFLLDRANVIHNWLHRNAARCEHHFTTLEPVDR